MLSNLRDGRWLQGFRDIPRVNRDAVIRLKGEVLGLTFRNFDIKEMDLNPFLVNRRGVSVVDLCILMV